MTPDELAPTSSQPGRNGDESTGHDTGTPMHSEAPARRFRRSAPKLAAFVAGTVTVLATAIAVVFQIDPGLAPCLGGRAASFTGAPVFPHYPYRRFLQDKGLNPSGYPNVMGAEVRYSYRVDDLRDQLLVLRMTLVSIARDGTIQTADTSQVDGNDLFEVQTVKPQQCSEGGGNTFFAHIPPGTRGRFQIYLELYLGDGYSDRIALGHTPTFDG